MRTHSHRHVSRPRPSLNCLTCRRRKVRCGREQPVCANCIRLNEPCRFETFPDKLNGEPSAADKALANIRSMDMDGGSSSSIIGNENGKRKNTRDSLTQPERDDHSGSIARGRESRHLADPTEGDAYFDIVDDSEMLDTSSSTLCFQNEPRLSPRPASLGHKSSPMINTRPNTMAVDIQETNDAQGAACDFGIEVQPARMFQNQHRASKEFHSLSQHPSSASVSELGYIPSGYTSSNTSGREPTHSGYLLNAKAVRPRYIEGSFWAFMKGQEHLCEELLAQNTCAAGSGLDPAIDALALANLLKSLPSRAICDAFLYSFLVGVRPIVPLIDVPSFRKDYNSFWIWAARCDSEIPSLRLLRDPTFFALLFAILYGGAVAVPDSWWSSTPLSGTDREAAIKKLHASNLSCLEFCNHALHPTLNTLIAALLIHTCHMEDAEPLKESVMIATLVRQAQILGLHVEPESFSSGDAEIRRRIWWHIVWLDLRSSMMHGTKLCCDPDHFDVQMVSEKGKDGSSNLAPRLPSRISSNESAPDSLLLLTIGRYETARFKSCLLNELNNTESLEPCQIDRFLTRVKELHVFLDRLMLRVPADGFPERGYIPIKLANASPLTNRLLYSNDTAGPTVFTSWARTILNMLKLDAAILLQKAVLGHADVESQQSRKLWHNAVQLCTSYLRNFTHLLKVSAFAPYCWLSCNRDPPLLAILMILIYLQYDRTSPKAQLAKYLVDEVIDIFSPNVSSSYAAKHKDWSEGFESPAAPSTHDSAQLSAHGGTSSVWSFIKVLRSRAGTIGNNKYFPDDLSKTPDPIQSARGPTSNSRSPFNNGQRSPRHDLEPKTAFSFFGSATSFANQSVAVSYPEGDNSSSYWSGQRDVEDLLDAPDFESCFSSLVQDTDGFLNGHEESLPPKGHTSHSMLTGLRGDSFDVDVGN